jgi:exosortase
MSSVANGTQTTRTPTIYLWAALAACAVWAVWPSIMDMTLKWSTDPTYSHGYIVPLFALGLLWFKRKEILSTPLQPNWWGVLLIVLAAAIQLTGSYFYVRWLSGASLLVYLAAASILLGGRRLLGLTWQAIAFLVFMIPLPYRVESALRNPLRRMATVVSTFVMQTIGLPATYEGNVIEVIGHDNQIQKIGVAEVCSGLSMLMTFFALAAGLVIVIRRPLLDKIIILASAPLIAIISNIIRITVTGILHVTIGEKVAEWVYHDVSGWLMMPMGVGLMWIEMKILENLFIERPRSTSRPIAAVLAPGLERSPVRGIGRT